MCVDEDVREDESCEHEEVRAWAQVHPEAAMSFEVLGKVVCRQVLIAWVRSYCHFLCL